MNNHIPGLSFVYKGPMDGIRFGLYPLSLKADCKEASLPSLHQSESPSSHTRQPQVTSSPPALPVPRARSRASTHLACSREHAQPL